MRHLKKFVKPMGVNRTCISLTNFLYMYHLQGRRKRGARLGGFSPPPQFFAKQLTLSQPGGQIMPTTILLAPQIFKLCDGPDL